MSNLKTWYLEREISKLQEEVYYWRGHYNKAMNFFLILTAQNKKLHQQLLEAKAKLRHKKRRKS